MKNIIKLTLMFALCCLCSCVQDKTPVLQTTAKIIEIYINDLEHKVYVMSDGGMAEIIIGDAERVDAVQFYDKNYNKLAWHKRASYDSLISQNFTKWLNAEVGRQVVLKRRSNGSRYYEVQIPSDTLIERKITRVCKYDGYLNQINGAQKLSGGLLCGTSGSGNISGEGMGCQNMFINIYFEDRNPIAVNAKENKLWLDVEAGMTVIEKRINGRTSFAPKF